MHVTMFAIVDQAMKSCPPGWNDGGVEASGGGARSLVSSLGIRRRDVRLTDLLALSESLIEPQGNWPMSDCMSNKGALASR